MDINQQDHLGETPLFHSTKANNLEATKLLINRGANVNHEDLKGHTPLIFASINKNEKTTA